MEHHRPRRRAREQGVVPHAPARVAGGRVLSFVVCKRGGARLDQCTGRRGRHCDFVYALRRLALKIQKQGLNDDVPEEQGTQFARELRDYLKTNKPDFIKQVLTEKVLSESSESMLKEAVNEVTSSMIATA